MKWVTVLMDSLLKIPVDKIGFDFDGVIADTGENFIRLACEEHGFCSFSLEQITSFEVEGSLDMPSPVIRKIFNDILEDSLATGLKPLSGVSEVFTEMTAVSTVHVITARPLLEPMADWFKAHFPSRVNSRLNLVATGSPESKAGFIHELGLEYFVDDRAETCEQLAGENIIPLVFEQPWNRNQHEQRSVSDWQQLREMLAL